MAKTTRAVVLLSGGQDSTTCLAWAHTQFADVLALSIYYGQRHASELDAARKIAAHFSVAHREISIPAFGGVGTSALTHAHLDVQGAGGIPDATMPEGLPTSFVPGRNALFLTLAGAVAVEFGAQHIVTGVCQTDFSGYPDCRRVFIDSMEQTLTLAMPSSSGPFTIHTPLMQMTKAETVRLAQDLGCMTALALSVTCYHGQRPGCGECPACQLRARGFAEAGVHDPAEPLRRRAP